MKIINRNYSVYVNISYRSSKVRSSKVLQKFFKRSVSCFRIQTSSSVFGIFLYEVCVSAFIQFTAVECFLSLQVISVAISWKLIRIQNLGLTSCPRYIRTCILTKISNYFHSNYTLDISCWKSHKRRCMWYCKPS